MKTLFWYAVIKDPTTAEELQGKQPELVVWPGKPILARDDQEVRLIAAREIPAGIIGKEADRIRIAVSSF